MFGSPSPASFSAAPGAGGFSTPQQNQNLSMTAIGSQLVSPNASGFGGLGVSMNPPPPSGGSPVFQSPAGNKFPAGGGSIVFTPQNNPAQMGSMAGASPASPYIYPGRSASNFVQSPPPTYGSSMGAAANVLSPPPYSSTMVASPAHQNPAANPVSPITHGYGQASQYANIQPFGYGARAMSGSYAYHQSYQVQQSPPHYGHHHSPREEMAEPMHCSPIGQTQQQHPFGSPQYQQPGLRNPNSPPRPQYIPAFLTGIDAVAAVPSRPRRVFDRSPSTSPPAVGVGGKSPSKSQNWTHDGIPQASSGYSSGQGEGGNMPGGYTKRAQGHGPHRHLRFTDSTIMQNGNQTTAEEKEKPKKSGPPIRGFGSSEEVSSFLNSPLLKENNDLVPGAAIAQEAIDKAGTKSPVAESNWITVFGFPSAAASFIYTHFAQYGSILQSKCNPGGNWLHIQYSSRIDARRALACNGKVLGGTIMVGVITSPREVIEMYEKPGKEENSGQGPSSSRSAQSGSSSAPVKSPLQEKNFSTSSSTQESGKSRTIRPLASGQMSASVIGGGAGDKSFSILSPSSTANVASPNQSQNENVPLPTVSSGLLTKAMEYMFGW